MIKIKNTVVYGWEAAIRGMRNSWESWDKSDSEFYHDQCCGSNVDCVKCDDRFTDNCNAQRVGKTDNILMMKLVSAGPDHSKFMRMIDATADVIAPLYWWKEMDTYKVGTVANSCSTMHTICKRKISLDDFSYERLRRDSILNLLKTINLMNSYMDAYNNPECLSDYKQECWNQIIQLLPSSYNQRRTIHLNYAVLRNIYHARNDHKLDEWLDFCRWIEGLPYSELITGGIKKE